MRERGEQVRPAGGGAAVAVDTAELRRLCAGLVLVRAELDLLRARADGVDGLAVGGRPLLVELERTASDWSVHAAALADVVAALERAVAAAAAGYERCEQDLSRRATAGPP